MANSTMYLIGLDMHVFSAWHCENVIMLVVYVKGCLSNIYDWIHGNLVFIIPETSIGSQRNMHEIATYRRICKNVWLFMITLTRYFSDI